MESVTNRVGREIGTKGPSALANEWLRDSRTFFSEAERLSCALVVRCEQTPVAQTEPLAVHMTRADQSGPEPTNGARLSTRTWVFVQTLSSEHFPVASCRTFLLSNNLLTNCIPFRPAGWKRLYLRIVSVIVWSRRKAATVADTADSFFRDSPSIERPDATIRDRFAMDSFPARFQG